jgi:limonene-1,2-epoxide hydrolase
MTTQHTESAIEVVTNFGKALDSGDIGKAFSFFTNSTVWHQPGNNKYSGAKHGPESIGKMLSSMMQDTQGTLKIVPTDSLMMNSHLVAMPVRFSAKIESRSIDMNGIDLYEVENGKITQVWLFSGDQSKEDDFWGN